MGLANQVKLRACFFFSFSPTNCEASTARVTGIVKNSLRDLALKAVQKAFDALTQTAMDRIR